MKKIRTKRSAAKGNDMPTSAHDVIVGDTPEGKKSAEAEAPVNIPTFFWAMVVVVGLAMLYFAQDSDKCLKEKNTIITDLNISIENALNYSNAANKCVSDYVQLENLTRACIFDLQRQHQVVCTWDSFSVPCDNQTYVNWQRVKQ